MTIKNHTFYFGKSDYKKSNYDEPPLNWEDGWDFRLVIEEDNGEIRIEDTCGRYVPMTWQSIHKMKKAIAAVERELVDSVLGDWTNEQSV